MTVKCRWMREMLHVRRSDIRQEEAYLQARWFMYKIMYKAWLYRDSRPTWFGKRKNGKACKRGCSCKYPSANEPYKKKKAQTKEKRTRMMARILREDPVLAPSTVATRTTSVKEKLPYAAQHL